MGSFVKKRTIIAGKLLMFGHKQWYVITSFVHVVVDFDRQSFSRAR